MAGAGPLLGSSHGGVLILLALRPKYAGQDEDDARNDAEQNPVGSAVDPEDERRRNVWTVGVVEELKRCGLDVAIGSELAVRYDVSAWFDERWELDDGDSVLGFEGCFTDLDRVAVGGKNANLARLDSGEE